MAWQDDAGSEYADEPELTDPWLDPAYERTEDAE